MQKWVTGEWKYLLVNPPLFIADQCMIHFTAKHKAGPNFLSVDVCYNVNQSPIVYVLLRA